MEPRILGHDDIGGFRQVYEGRVKMDELMTDSEVAVRKDGVDSLNMEDQIRALEEAGMAAAAKSLRTGLDRKRKLMIAYEHYRFVTEEKMNAYRERLKKAT